MCTNTWHCMSHLYFGYKDDGLCNIVMHHNLEAKEHMYAMHEPAQPQSWIVLLGFISFGLGWDVADQFL